MRGMAAAYILVVMQPIDKFKADLDDAAKRATGRGEAAEIEALRSFFFRSFPRVGDEAKAALFASYLERRRADDDAGLAWLSGVGSILMMDYDGTPLSKADWEDIRESIVLEEEDLDIELLEYVLSLVLDHRAL
jgi:hypothetical protein